MLKPEKVLEHCNVTQLPKAKGLYRDDLLEKSKALASRTHDFLNVEKADREFEVRIRPVLSEYDQELLKQSYPSLKFKFLQSSTEAHGYAHASRIAAENFILRDLIRYSHTKRNYVVSVVPSQGGVSKVMKETKLVCDIGGSALRHMSNGRTNIHSCCPVLDAHDMVRFVTYKNAAQDYCNASTNQYTKLIATSIIAGSDNYVCNKKAQDCGVAAKYGMMIHSNYDINVNNIVDIMVRKSMTSVFIVCIFSPDILLKNSGVISKTVGNRNNPDVDFGLRVNWERFYKNVNGKKKEFIRFSFRDDPSFNYEHEYETYIGWFTKSIVVDKSLSNCGIMQIKTIINGEAIIEITRAPEGWQQKLLNVTFSLQIPFLSDYVVLESYKLENTRLTRALITIPRFTYEQVLSYALRQSEAKFNLTQIYSMACASNVRIIVNGTDVAAADSITPSDLLLATAAIYVIAYLKRYDSGQFLKMSIDDIRFVRENAKKGWLTRFVKKQFRKIDNGIDIMMGEIGDLNSFNMQADSFSQDEIHRHTRSVFERFRAWLSDLARLKNLLPVKCNEMCRQISVEQSIEVSKYWKNKYGDPYNITYDSKLLEKIEAKLEIEENLEKTLDQLLEDDDKVDDGSVLKEPEEGVVEVVKSDDYEYKFEIINDTSKFCARFNIPASNSKGGECWYDTMRQLMDLKITNVELRDALLKCEQMKYLNDTEKASVYLVLTAPFGSPESYGNVDLTKLACYYFGVNICVHCAITVSGKEVIHNMKFTLSNKLNTIHVKYTAFATSENPNDVVGHYEPVLDMFKNIGKAKSDDYLLKDKMILENGPSRGVGGSSGKDITKIMFNGSQLRKTKTIIKDDSVPGFIHSVDQGLRKCLLKGPVVLGKFKTKKDDGDTSEPIIDKNITAVVEDTVNEVKSKVSKVKNLKKIGSFLSKWKKQKETSLEESSYDNVAMDIGSSVTELSKAINIPQGFVDDDYGGSSTELSSLDDLVEMPSVVSTDIDFLQRKYDYLKNSVDEVVLCDNTFVVQLKKEIGIYVDFVYKLGLAAEEEIAWVAKLNDLIKTDESDCASNSTVETILSEESNVSIDSDSSEAFSWFRTLFVDNMSNQDDFVEEAVNEPEGEDVVDLVEDGIVIDDWNKIIECDDENLDVVVDVKQIKDKLSEVVEDISVIKSFEDYTNNYSTYSGKNIEFIVGDLFDCNGNYVHCISRDKHMSAGIAVNFVKNFGRPEGEAGVGSLLIQDCGNSKVYHLVTKEKFNHKPTYVDVFHSLKLLSEVFEGKLYCPKLACGRDKLDFSIILGFLDYLEIPITVVLEGDEKFSMTKLNQSVFPRFVEQHLAKSGEMDLLYFSKNGHREIFSFYDEETKALIREIDTDPCLVLDERMVEYYVMCNGIQHKVTQVFVSDDDEILEFMSHPEQKKVNRNLDSLVLSDRFEIDDSFPVTFIDDLITIKPSTTLKKSVSFSDKIDERVIDDFNDSIKVKFDETYITDDFGLIEESIDGFNKARNRVKMVFCVYSYEASGVVLVENLLHPLMVPMREHLENVLASAYLDNFEGYGESTCLFNNSPFMKIDGDFYVSCLHVDTYKKEIIKILNDISSDWAFLKLKYNLFLPIGFRINRKHNFVCNNSVLVTSHQRGRSVMKDTVNAHWGVESKASPGLSFEDNSFHNQCVGMVNEFRQITEITVNTVLSRLNIIWNDVVVMRKFNNSKYITTSGNNGITFINLVTGRLYGRKLKEEDIPTHVYAGNLVAVPKLENFYIEMAIELKSRKNYFNNSDNWHTYYKWLGNTLNIERVILIPELYKFIDSMMIDALDKIELDNFSQKKITLINGVPGCGKTQFIVDNHKPIEELILTSTKEASIDLRNRVCKKHEGLDADRVSEYYRTIDSYLINDIKEYDRIFIDEALMQHPGKIICAMAKSKCKEVILLGDKAQIPYVCRLSNYNPIYNDFEWVREVKHLDTTIRCPLDVAAVLYKEENINIFSINESKRKTITLKKINNLGAIQCDKHYYYLTFTQDEKKTLINHLKINNAYVNNVSTVHEYQGKQHKHIRVVRTNFVEATAIFNKSAYCLVAISRHTESFVYYCITTIVKDKLISYCNTANRLTGADLDSRVTTLDDYNAKRVIISATNLSAGWDYATKNLARDAFPVVVDPYSVIQGKTVRNTNVDTFNRYSIPNGLLDPTPQKSGNLNLNEYNIVFDTLEIMEKPFIDVPDEDFIDYVEFNRGLNLRNSLDWELNRPYEYYTSVLVQEDVLDRLNLDVSADIASLQVFYDQYMGKSSAVDISFDSEMVKYGNKIYSLANCTLRLDKIAVFNAYNKDDDGYYIKSDEKRFIPPVLRTVVPPNREKNFGETILAFIKRNANVPELKGTGDDDELVNIMLNKFVTSYVSKAKLPLFHEYRSMPVAPTVSGLKDWSNKKLKSKLNQRTPNMSEIALNNYHYMIKSEVKPELNYNATNNYKALQTIAYHDKDINAVFSPIFKVLRKRFIKVLDRRFMIFCDMSVKEFEEQMSRVAPPDFLRNFQSLMVDISKYDKSQGAIMRKFENAFYRMLGLEYHLSDLWDRCHENSSLKANEEGFKARIKEQRKSGDSNTFFGNTIFTMAVMAMIIDMRNVVFATFGGDDSIITGDNIRDDYSHVLATTFNLETKFYNYGFYYFCSRFLVPVNQGWLVVPDILKIISKLGRTDVRDYIHLEEYRRSLADLLKSARDVRVDRYISFAYKEIYKMQGDPGHALTVLLNFVYYPGNFSKLFELTEDMEIDMRYRKKYIVCDEKVFLRLRMNGFKKLIWFSNDILNILVDNDDKVILDNVVLIVSDGSLIENRRLLVETYVVNNIRVGLDKQRNKFSYLSYDWNLVYEEFVYSVLGEDEQITLQQPEEEKQKILEKKLKISLE